MKKAAIISIALALALGGCGESDSSTQEEESVLTGEETTFTPQELNDEETSGEAPEKEPVRQNDETTDQ